MVELRENEIRILAALDKLNKQATVEQLTLECELPDTAVMRSALILQENGLQEAQRPGVTWPYAQDYPLAIRSVMGI